MPVAGANLRETARRRLRLPVLVIAPAHYAAVVLNPAAVHIAGANLHKVARRRRRLPQPVVAPADHPAFGVRSASVKVARANLLKLNRRRRGLSPPVIPPAHPPAVRPHRAGMPHAGADLLESPRRRPGLQKPVIPPAHYAPLAVYPARVRVTGADLLQINRRRRGLPGELPGAGVDIAAPAGRAPVRPHPASMPKARADLRKGTRRPPGYGGQRLQTPAHLIRRQRVAHPLGALQFDGVNADHRPAAIDQRPAAAARIQRRVRLQIVIPVNILPRRNDAPRRRQPVPRLAQRKPQRHHIVPHRYRQPFAQRYGRELGARVQLYHRQVGLVILRQRRPPIPYPRQNHHHILLAVHHMSVGRHQPGGIVHKPRPAAFRRNDLRQAGPDARHHVGHRRRRRWPRRGHQTRRRAGQMPGAVGRCRHCHRAGRRRRRRRRDPRQLGGHRGRHIRRRLLHRNAARHPCHQQQQQQQRQSAPRRP